VLQLIHPVVCLIDAAATYLKRSTEVAPASISCWFLIKDSCTAKKRSSELSACRPSAVRVPSAGGRGVSKATRLTCFALSSWNTSWRKAARDSPSSFAQLARVDRAFRDATRRCSQTLGGRVWRIGTRTRSQVPDLGTFRNSGSRPEGMVSTANHRPPQKRRQQASCTSGWKRSTERDRWRRS
jgi:hypothetical protein